MVEAAVESAEEAGFERIRSQRELAGMPRSQERCSSIENDGAEIKLADTAVEPVNKDGRHYVVGSISTSDRFNTDPDVLRGLVDRFGAEGEAMEETPALRFRPNAVFSSSVCVVSVIPAVKRTTISTRRSTIYNKPLITPEQ